MGACALLLVQLATPLMMVLWHALSRAASIAAAVFCVGSDLKAKRRGEWHCGPRKIAWTAHPPFHVIFRFAKVVLLEYSTALKGGPQNYAAGDLSTQLCVLCGVYKKSTTSSSSSLAESQPATSPKLTPVSGCSCTLLWNLANSMGLPMLRPCPHHPCHRRTHATGSTTCWHCGGACRGMTRLPLEIM